MECAGKPKAQRKCFERIFPAQEQISRSFQPQDIVELLWRLSRRLDRSRHLYLHIDTDGWCEPVIPLYKELGMDMMSPMEVASGCDVVEIGKKYPDLIILGGVDKRELAKGKGAIDRMIDRIFPAMQKRGGYIPTCDHGVPAEVSLENYMHYRKRALEFA